MDNMFWVRIICLEKCEPGAGGNQYLVPVDRNVDPCTYTPSLTGYSQLLTTRYHKAIPYRVRNGERGNDISRRRSTSITLTDEGLAYKLYFL